MKSFLRIGYIAVLPLLFLSWETKAQITVVTGSTATELAERLAGEGVTVSGATLTGCTSGARGMFSATGVAYAELGIDSGIVLTCGSAATVGTTYGINAAYDDFASTSFSGSGDDDLDSLLAENGSSVTTNDACVLEFDFIPTGDTVKFEYVFGSEEYPEFACSGFNDVFGFFISGPGIVGLRNIALVPGTTIPVAINTINKAPDGTGYSISTCNSLGTGSPFDEYYVDNEDDIMSDYISYDGYTTVLQARSNVNPCDTYHLKLAIADGGDWSYDSGVMLQAGSLSSTALDVTTFGGGGLEVPYTNMVRGCPPGKFTVTRSGDLGSSIDVPYTVSGTAVDGVDYASLPGFVTIPAGSASADVWIYPTILPAPVGPKTLIIDIFSPYFCAAPIVLSTDTITIFDELFIEILSPDTAICVGDSVVLHAHTDTVLDFAWSPATLVPSITDTVITVAPTVTTTYTASVSMAGVACPAATQNVTISVKYPPEIDLGPDKKICLDGGVELNPVITPTPDSAYTYSWYPPVGLSSTTIPNPIANPLVTTTYYLTVNPGAEGCSGTDSITVRILPNDIELLNNDTVVCAGSVVTLNANGHPEFSYQWTPEDGIVNPNIPVTAITATESDTITITASHEGCDDMVHSFYLEVQPVPDVNLGPDRTICFYDTIQLFANTTPSYDDYIYKWTPTDMISDSTIKDPVFRGFSSETYIVEVSTPLGCSGSDTINITVNPNNFMTVSPQEISICPDVDSVVVTATGASSYVWTPAAGLSRDSFLSNPTTLERIVIDPSLGSQTYMILGENGNGCVVTEYVYLNVHPAAVTYMPDSVQIWPGESYEIEMNSNALYFNWFPPEGLSAANIPNPVASPEVRTRYFVTATTENGCKTIDSIDIVVNLESVLDLPNAFVPGNTNVNNGIFKPVYRGNVTLNSFKVFDRWGQLMFETTDINAGWDGKYKDAPQPMGVYVYQIDASLSSGRRISKSGTVTLIR